MKWIAKKMNVDRWQCFAGVVLVFGLVGSLPCAADTADAESRHEPKSAQERGRAELDDLVAPLLQGGGTWRATNGEHKAGDANTAAFWRLEHEWIFEHTLLRYRISGEFEDGHMTTYWEGSIFWDPRLGVARAMQIHPSGILGWGDLQRIGPDSVEFAVTFHHPGGGLEAFRDVMKMTGSKTMESRSYSYDAAEWKWLEKRVEHWTLIE